MVWMVGGQGRLLVGPWDDGLGRAAPALVGRARNGTQPPSSSSVPADARCRRLRTRSTWIALARRLNAPAGGSVCVLRTTSLANALAAVLLADLQDQKAGFGSGPRGARNEVAGGTAIVRSPWTPWNRLVPEVAAEAGLFERRLSGVIIGWLSSRSCALSLGRFDVTEAPWRTSSS